MDQFNQPYMPILGRMAVDSPFNGYGGVGGYG